MILGIGQGNFDQTHKVACAGALAFKLGSVAARAISDCRRESARAYWNVALRAQDLTLPGGQWGMPSCLFFLSPWRRPWPWFAEMVTLFSRNRYIYYPRKLCGPFFILNGGMTVMTIMYCFSLAPWPAAAVSPLRGHVPDLVTLCGIHAMAWVAGSRSSARCKDTPSQKRLHLILAGVAPGLYRLATLCAFSLRTRPSLLGARCAFPLPTPRGLKRQPSFIPSGCSEGAAKVPVRTHWFLRGASWFCPALSGSRTGHSSPLLARITTIANNAAGRAAPSQIITTTPPQGRLPRGQTVTTS